MAGLLQGVLGVKVRVTLPDCPAGLKVEPLTPGPDQLPVGKAGSCKVLRLRGASVWHKVAVPRLGVPDTLTVTVVVAGLLQGVLGVKVRVIFPDCPAGLKVEPLTPGPDQLPVGKAGSCKVLRLRGASVWHKVAVPRLGVVGMLTVIVVVAGLTQLPVGVNVRVTLPDCPAGLKVEPLTPGPDQLPVGKAGSSKVLRLSGPPVWHTVAVPRLGVAAALTVMLIVAVLEQPVPGLV